MQRATKIVATLGPATSSPEVLERLIEAGVDVVRMNFSHGTVDDHQNRARLVREIGARYGKPIGILADLQGPKIRVGKFIDNKIMLKAGDKFILDADCEGLLFLGLGFCEFAVCVERSRVGIERRYVVTDRDRVLRERE